MVEARFTDQLPGEARTYIFKVGKDEVGRAPNSTHQAGSLGHQLVASILTVLGGRLIAILVDSGRDLGQALLNLLKIGVKLGHGILGQG